MGEEEEWRGRCGGQAYSGACGGDGDAGAPLARPIYRLAMAVPALRSFSLPLRYFTLTCMCLNFKGSLQ